MQTWLTRAAIVVAAGLTLAAVWGRLPEFSSNQFLLYPALLFPYALFALTTRQGGRHLPLLLGGMIALAGFWLWVLVQEPAAGPSLAFAVVTHLIVSTVLGITVTVMGRRTPPETFSS